jgi:hypothetical protein
MGRLAAAGYVLLLMHRSAAAVSWAAGCDAWLEVAMQESFQVGDGHALEGCSACALVH